MPMNTDRASISMRSIRMGDEYVISMNMPKPAPRFPDAGARRAQRADYTADLFSSRVSTA